MVRNRDLENEIIFYEGYIKKVSVELDNLIKKVPKDFPKDVCLRVATCQNTYQYFLREKGAQKNGRYIRKKDRKIAELLAQIEYDEKLITLLNQLLDEMKKLKRVWVDNPFVYVYENMTNGKRDIVKIPYATDESFVINWKKQIFEVKGFKEGFPEFYTRNGLRVRSKSEVIIADILDEMCIPFLYEKPLKLQSGLVHPDFTLLNLKDRKEIYWEHFGMMDDIEYRNNAFLKMRKYESSGYYQHDSMIWTFETGNHPLNIKEVRKMIAMLKQKFGY